MLVAFLESLRIPIDDCVEYEKRLIAGGFDDPQSLLEDASLELLESCGIKMGHIQRILNSKLKQSNESAEDSPPILENSNSSDRDPYPDLSLTIPPKIHSMFSDGGFKITPYGIESIPDELSALTCPTSLNQDDNNESDTVPRYTTDATVVLRKVGRGASSTVYKALYIPTLTFIAVS